MSSDLDPHELDPDYDRHGGFPRIEITDPPPGFGEFLSAMRRAQDLAVSTAADPATWAEAAGRVDELVNLLAPHRAPAGVAPAGRTPALPGAGSLLMPPWTIRDISPAGVLVDVEFSRFHVGGNNAVHGGVVAMMFDVVCGMIIHAVGRPISRTAFLHVDYRNITPIDVRLTVRGWADRIEGRKTFVNAELTDPDGVLLAEANGLMVQLLPGQP